MPYLPRLALALALALAIPAPALAAPDVSFDNEWGGKKFLKDHGQRICRLEKTATGWTCYSLELNREFATVKRDPNGGFVVVALDGKELTASGNLDDENEVGFAIATFIDRGSLATTPPPMPIPTTAPAAPAAPAAASTSTEENIPIMRNGVEIAHVTTFTVGNAGIIDAQGNDLGIIGERDHEWRVSTL